MVKAASTRPAYDVIGVDPGARDTGVVVLHGGTKLTMETLHNGGDILPPPGIYIQRVLEALEDLRDAHPDAFLNVESIVRPSWHVESKAAGGAARNPEPLLATGIILGAIMGAHPDARIVPPNKNGSRPLAAYPDCLVSDRERARDGWQSNTTSRGKLRHMRSAYDVACYPGPFGDVPVITDTPRRINGARMSRKQQALMLDQATTGTPQVRRLDLRKKRA